MYFNGPTNNYNSYQNIGERCLSKIYAWASKFNKKIFSCPNFTKSVSGGIIITTDKYYAMLMADMKDWSNERAYAVPFSLIFFSGSAQLCLIGLASGKVSKRTWQLYMYVILIGYKVRKHHNNDLIIITAHTKHLQFDY